MKLIYDVPRFYYSGKENTNVIMDCCQLEQECPATVKKEVLVDETDRKTPDQDSSGKSHYFAVYTHVVVQSSNL